MKKEKCPHCGEEFKNVGSHLRFCQAKEGVVADEYLPEKPLNSLISEMKEILKSYQNQITVKTTEQNGKTTEIEITARIQTR